ncbi:MAG: hypothetical protein ACHQDC_06980, partial [Acidimicrobiales bacterium]
IKRSAPGLSEPTLEYVVVNPAGAHDALVVRVELGASGGDAHDVAGRVTTAIKDALGIDAAVEVLDRGALPRSSYKLKRVVDA